MDKLKPCPFCGEEAKIFTDDEMGYLGNDKYLVKCGNCLCGTGHYNNPEYAIEAWNKRAKDNEDKKMRSYTINLPRGLEVDIFNLPENFVEEINRVFGEYTQETSKDYRDCDRLGFIDCCVRHINGNKDSYDVVDQKVEDYITSQWREYGQLDNKDDVYSADFMADCYAEGARNAVLCSHFGVDDHNIYDKIQKVLVQVITIVMNYRDEED